MKKPEEETAKNARPEALSGAIHHLPQLPKDDEGPVFAAPWQAEAFAMTLALYEKGCFTWGEWAQTLGGVIKREERAGNCPQYYEAWMLALEEMVRNKGILSLPEMATRKEHWEKAALATPHGKPILLENAR